jgi:hypothetical protein
VITPRSCTVTVDVATKAAQNIAPSVDKAATTTIDFWELVTLRIDRARAAVGARVGNEVGPEG